jgi:hypothetical protein
MRYKWKLVALSEISAGTCRREVDIEKVCWVSPRRIVYCSLREFTMPDFKGRVIGGDWDRLEKRFEDSDVYIALKQVSQERKDWSETIFY